MVVAAMPHKEWQLAVYLLSTMIPFVVEHDTNSYSAANGSCDNAARGVATRSVLAQHHDPSEVEHDIISYSAANGSCDNAA